MNTNHELITLTWWLVFASFSASLTALIIAIWGNRLSSLLFKPRLEFQYKHKWPDAIKIPISKRRIIISPIPKEEIHNFAVSYYFRFRIRNKGNVTANNVEVFINKIEKQSINKNYEPYKPFIPLNLGWSNTDGQMYFPLIPPKISKHCDLGLILHPQKRQINEMIEYSEEGNSCNFPGKEVIFQISFVVKPNVLESYYLIPGVYRLEVIAMASNSKMKKQKFELVLKDKWIDNSEEMLSESVGLKLIQ